MQYDYVFIKKKKVNVDPETGITKERLYEQIKRKCHMNIRVMLSSTKEHLRLSGLEDARKHPSLEPSERHVPAGLLFELLSSGTVKQ